jgi:hypothetical protein
MSVIINSEEHNLKVFCVLAADSRKPNELMQHLETKHSEMKNKAEKYLPRKRDEIAPSKRVLLILLL